MIKEVVDELESALEWCAEGDNPNGSIAVKIWAVRKALEFLKPRKPAYTNLMKGYCRIWLSRKLIIVKI